MDRVTKADLPDVTGFLRSRVERAMFPLSNLAEFGLGGDHDYAPRMWARRVGGRVAGVLTLTRNATVLPACAPQDTLSVLKGRRVATILGPAAECRPVIGALGLDRAKSELDRDEPHFDLRLNRLRVPDGPGRLRPLEEGGVRRMIAWRAAYEVEVLGQSPDTARRTAPDTIASYVSRGSHRVLMDGETPLAVTGFNARLPDIVQIGGVYTPPELRGRGHARRAVALHLAEARAAGAERATLFAASAGAARTYEAVGFERIGAWTLFALAEPVDA